MERGGAGWTGPGLGEHYYQPEVLHSLLLLHSTALRLAIYSGADTKIALTGPPSEILTSNFLGYVDMTLT